MCSLEVLSPQDVSPSYLVTPPAVFIDGAGGKTGDATEILICGFIQLSLDGHSPRYHISLVLTNSEYSWHGFGVALLFLLIPGHGPQNMAGNSRCA